MAITAVSTSADAVLRAAQTIVDRVHWATLCEPARIAGRDRAEIEDAVATLLQHLDDLERRLEH